MNATVYQTLAARTLIDAPKREYTDDELMIIWNAIGLAGEAGEVADIAKKGILHDHGLDEEALIKELGDCLWYIAALCTKLNVNMSQVMEQNIAKLKERYPNGFSAADSIKRIDIQSEGV